MVNDVGQISFLEKNRLNFLLQLSDPAREAFEAGSDRLPDAFLLLKVFDRAFDFASDSGQIDLGVKTVSGGRLKEIKKILFAMSTPTFIFWKCCSRVIMAFSSSCSSSIICFSALMAFSSLAALSP